MVKRTKASVLAIALFLIVMLAFGGNDAFCDPLPDNNPPNIPSNPSPANGGTNNWIILAPGWDGGDPDGDSVTYEIYKSEGDCDNPIDPAELWATLENIPGDKTRIETTDYCCEEIPLRDLFHDLCTCYYWKVVATDSQGASVTSAIWKSRTRGLFITSPSEDEAVIIGETNTIKWEWCDDPDYPCDETYTVRIQFTTRPKGCIPSPEYKDLVVDTDDDGEYEWDTSGYSPGDMCHLRIITQTESGDDIGYYQSPVFSMVENSDIDGDGTVDAKDNCPEIANPDQLDCDSDGLGDACEEGIGGEISVAVDTLWPPNHKHVDVGMDLSGIKSSNKGNLTIALSVCSDEEKDSEGDGNTNDDILIEEDGTLLLRAEREGKVNGRVYTISAQIVDWAGDTHTSVATVKVPKSKGENAVADLGSGYCKTLTITK